MNDERNFAGVLDPLTAIDVIYGRCRPEGLLAFGSRRPTRRKPQPFPHDMFILPAGDRHNWLPAVFAHMVSQTQYGKPSTYTVAALVEGDIERYQNAIRIGRPLYYAALQRNVMELVALVVDLDVGRHPGEPGDLTAGQALGAVIDRVQANILPPPSLAAYSGRGAYLWWLLTAADGHPPINDPDNNAQRRLIAGELVNRTRDLEADQAAAKDENHWFKRPGTVDTNTGRRVDYLTWGLGHPSAVPLYRLPELMEILDLHHSSAELPPPAERPGSPKDSSWSPPSPRPPRRPSRNCAAPERRRMEEIELLAVHREGIREGMRELTLWHYYHACRKFKFKARKSEAEGPDLVGEAQAETRKFNTSYCRPPLEPGEVNGVFRPLSRGEYSANGLTVSRALHVTDEEADALDLRALATEARRRMFKQEAASKAEEFQARRDRTDPLLLKGLRVKEVMRQTGERRQYVNDRKKVLLSEGKLEPDPAPQIDLVTS